MKKNIVVALAAISALTVQSCRKSYHDGPSVTKNYNATGFTSIDAGLGGDVYYTQDSVYKVEIYAPSGVQDKIETPVVNGELRLQFKKFSNLGWHERVVVYVSSPSVNGLSVNGSGTLSSTAPVTAGNMDLKVNGSGKINLSSYTGTNLSANISGSGNITVSGGNVVSSNLRISGSGDIYMLNLDAENVTMFFFISCCF